MSKSLPASVRQRLTNKAKETNRPFQELLQYFAMERFLLDLAAPQLLGYPRKTVVSEKFKARMARFRRTPRQRHGGRRYCVDFFINKSYHGASGRKRGGRSLWNSISEGIWEPRRHPLASA